MQGMNFIAGIVLMIFYDDDVLAFTAFVKLMQIDNWRCIYTEDTPKFFELVFEVKKHCKAKFKKLWKHFEDNEILWEPLLASPFITLFTNVVDVASSMAVLERFMLLG